MFQIDELSGSLQLKEQYEQKKNLQSQAEEEMLRNFERKKNINKEKKQLKEQKEESDRYQDLATELINARVEYFLWQLYHVDVDRSKEIDELALEKSNLEAKRAQVAEVEQSQELLARTKATLHKERVAVEKKLAAKQKEAEKKVLSVSKLQEQLTQTQKQLADADKKAKALDKEHQAQQEQRAALQSELQAVSASFARLEEEEAADGGELKLAVAQRNEYQKLKQTADAATASVAREAGMVRHEHETLQEKQHHLATSVQTLRNRLTECKTAAAKLATRKEEMEKALLDSEERLTAIRGKFDEENDLIRQTAEKKKKLEDSIETLNRALLESKADRRDNEREQKLSEATLQMKRLWAGVRGRLVDLCRPSHNKYVWLPHLFCFSSAHHDALVRLCVLYRCFVGIVCNVYWRTMHLV
jgi:structural maintenance of chromosome 1